MAARKTTIEFLPREDWERGLAGGILKWTLTVGRHIVIFTELVVILVFLSRFKLDRDLTDLGEKIKQQQVIITSWNQFEKEFRFLGKRLQTIESLRKSQIGTGEILDELATLTPVDVYLSDFDVNGKQVSLTATALSEIGLRTFLRNLEDSPKFENLSLSQVSSDIEKEIGIKFQLKGELIQK
jgi:Tfp pilus assembly protein PilN